MSDHEIYSDNAETGYNPAAESDNPLIQELWEEHPAIDHDTDMNEVYEEGEEGIAYTPLHPIDKGEQL